MGTLARQVTLTRTGFTAMLEHESPRHVANLLLTRYPLEKLPGVLVVYDNACNLAAFCMVREPYVFRSTRFLVDRLHSKGHTCPAAFHLRAYDGDARLASINSQVAEQGG